MSTKQNRTRGEDYQAPVPVPRIARTRGRPSDYEPEMVAHASELAALGHTMQEIADEMGVSRTSVWTWQKNYPEFLNAVKKARDAQDDRVEEALRINAVLNHNPTAQIFWLKNRRPNEWRDRKETEIIVPVTDDVGEVRDARGAALAALALFNEAQYDPGSAGVLLEATANAEESDDGEEDLQPGRGHRDVEAPDDDDWERGDDLDPGEI